MPDGRHDCSALVAGHPLGSGRNRRVPSTLWRAQATDTSKPIDANFEFHALTLKLRLASDMPLDELPTDHRGVAGGKPRCHAQALLERAHVRLDVVVNAEAIDLQVLDPVLAAPAVGITAYVDRAGGLGEGRHEQAGKRSQTKCPVHNASPRSVATAGTAAAATCLYTLCDRSRRLDLGLIAGLLQGGRQRLVVGVTADAHPARREVDQHLGNSGDPSQCGVHMADTGSATHTFNTQIGAFHRVTPQQ